MCVYHIVFVYYRRTVRKTTERGRKKVIRKTSPRLSCAVEKSSTSSSDSDNYRQLEIMEKSSQDDATFWGRKPPPPKMHSCSSNSDSSGNESGSHKGSRENTPELSSDMQKDVTELKEMFAKKSDNHSMIRRSPHVIRRKVSEEKPTAAARLKPNDSLNFNVLLRPRQSEIVHAHFASAPSDKKQSPPPSVGILEEIQSELESTSSSTKPKKAAPPTPQRKESIQNSPPVKCCSGSAEPNSGIETPKHSDDDGTALHDRAMEAILKVLLQNNGLELQNLVKQAVASNPELLKSALLSNQ